MACLATCTLSVRDTIFSAILLAAISFVLLVDAKALRDGSEAKQTMAYLRAPGQRLGAPTIFSNKSSDDTMPDKPVPAYRVPKALRDPEQDQAGRPLLANSTDPLALASASSNKHSPLVVEGREANLRSVQAARALLTDARAAHSKSLSDHVHEIVTFQSYGQLLVTEVEVDTESGYGSSTCIDPPRLTMDTVEQVGASIFSMSTFHLQHVSCHGAEVTYKALGHACVHTTVDLLGMLYDKGIVSMALGAEQGEAFAQFLHARSLLWSLQQCEAVLNCCGKTALPSSYSVLYALFETRLLTRLRHSFRLAPRDLPPDAIPILLAASSLASRRQAAVTLPLVEPMLPATHLPFADAIFAATAAAAAASSVRAVGITEGECDAGEDEAARYFVQRLRQIVLEDVHQECCASECASLAAVTRDALDLETCCVGCNRWSCRPSDAGGASVLAGASTVTRPGSARGPPQIVSLVV
jgi:hypothetical protein